MNRNRLSIVVVLLVALLAAGATRQWASDFRRSGSELNPSSSGGANLSRMNSYALALLLGGLRGPLVMFLWPSAEEQKTQRNLEDLDTKIEWIRMLQAEFDSVHIFQIWNKAWNISVQMSSLVNKYRTILDAADYAHQVDAERPNNININYAMARVYADKLGYSDEKAYYMQRFRQETQARVETTRITLPALRRDELAAAVAAAGHSRSQLRFSEELAEGTTSVIVPKTLADKIRSSFAGPQVSYMDRPPSQLVRVAGGQRSEMDPLLDPSGMILPQYLSPRLNRPASLPEGSEWNDGSELQYLKKYQPFPYGISPLGLGYNYYKRAQVLGTVYQQRHAEMTEEVVGTRPAVAMRLWADEEWERARRAEVEAMGRIVPTDRVAMESASADVRLDSNPTTSQLFEEAQFSCDLSIRLMTDSIAEYNRHFAVSKEYIARYLATLDDLETHTELLKGDSDYLRAMLDPQKRAEYSRSAADHYRRAISMMQMLIILYYAPENADALFPNKVSRAEYGSLFKNNQLTPAQVDEMYNKITTTFAPNYINIENRDYFLAELAYLSRAQTRLKNLP